MVLRRLSHPRPLAILVALCTPPGYLGYTMAIRFIQGDPVVVRPVTSTPMLLYFLLLAVVGILVVGLWATQLRHSLVVAVGGFLWWPWLYVQVPVGGAGPLAIPFAVVLVTTTVEGLVRCYDHIETELQKRRNHYALAGGICHAIVGLSLQIYGRTGYPDAFFSALAMGISAFALIGLGALPIVAWQRRRLVLPAVTLNSWVAWGILGAWQLRESLPLGAFSGIRWVGLPPAPDYALKWTVLCLALVSSITVELGARWIGEVLRSTATAESS